MRRIAWIGALALAAACGGDDDGGDSDGDTFVGEIAYEVEGYELAVDLGTNASQAAVRVKVTTAGDCLTIPYRLTGINAASLENRPQAGLAIDGSTLRVCDGSGAGFPVGATVTLRTDAALVVGTELPLDVGLSTQEDAAGGQYTYLVSWVGGCDKFGPCDRRAGAFATYRFVVTHDAETQVLCPGRVTATATQTTCDFDYPGGPTYSTFGLMARKPAWTRTELGDWGGVAASLYDYAGTQIREKFPTEDAKGQLAWLETRFGAFPYGDELRFVVGDTYWAGFEHPGNVSLAEYLGTSNSAYFDGLQHTVMHEIVHMWAGDHATLADTYDFVWKEAMAEYLTYVYEDEALGAMVSVESKTYWKAVSQAPSYFLVPGEKPPLAMYYGDVYGPGPMILFRQLEVKFGREAVLAAIDALIGTGMPRTLSVDDVQAALETATGADLAAYFAAWVHGMGAPAFPTAEVTFMDQNVLVNMSTSDGVARGCKFHVRVNGPGPADTALLEFDNLLTGAPLPPQPVGFVPMSYELDPDFECLVYDPPGMKPGLPRLEPWLM